MIGQVKLLKKLEDALIHSTADQTEVVFIGTESGLTRFANSYIHQNVHENNGRVLFRSVLGNRVGVAVTNSLTAAELKKSLADSIEIAKRRPEFPGFAGLPREAKYRELNTFDEVTAKVTPNGRARAVKRIIGEAKRKRFTVAGSCSSSRGEMAVVNSLGLRAYQPTSYASVNMIAMSDTSSGYASSVSRRFNDLEFVELARRAVTKCDISQNPTQIEPGEYEVILEPAAVAEMLEWLNYVGFGSKMYQQKMSLLSGKKGKRITSDKITVYDNALDERAVAFPFDFEGVPKKKVMFINKGIAGGPVYDRTSAKKDGVKSTGHALGADESSEGAFGGNLFMAPGRVPREKMLRDVKRGILVTRFHYLNGLIDPPNSVLTGMTRDGTFLVENGEVVGGLKNMRFTDSFTRAFGSCVAISREVERIESWWRGFGCMTTPTVHLGSFRFTGKTEF